jgi:hypothetical protein
MLRTPFLADEASGQFPFVFANCEDDRLASLPHPLNLPDAPPAAIPILS